MEISGLASGTDREQWKYLVSASGTDREQWKSLVSASGTDREEWKSWSRPYVSLRREEDLTSCTIACQTSVLIARPKMTKVTLRRNENHFSTSKPLNHFGTIVSNLVQKCVLPQDQ